MHILRVAQDIFPETVGGAPYHIHALSRDQAAMGHEVTVLTVSEEVEEREVTDQDGYTLIKQPPKLELLGNQIFANTVGDLRGLEDFDVVHTHSHLFFSSNVAALYCRMANIPIAITCHGLNSQRGPFWFSRAHLRTLGKWTYDSADVTLCYTDVEQSKLRDLGVDADIAVVNNGIDTNRFSPAGQTHPDIASQGGQAIVFVGRLVDGKRPQDVLAAFDTVRERCPDASLFFCGDGPLRDSLESTVADEGLTDAVEFLGRVPYQKMPSVFRAADLFVLPSRTEGFPRTVIEALACETPVVASDLEQTSKIVNQTGETVQVGNVEGFATAISDLLSDQRGLSELGKHGRAIVTTRYNWEETVQETTEILGQVAEIGDSVIRDKTESTSSPTPVVKDEI
ncbi:glycosyl transferase family 1 (plasmid) [Haloarcula hispanica N601]|uniref:Glycosyl transferase family 1 n=3 Tax=Haloarcula hispanica TaxID=51589 RepID=V5TT77_HALHI|nr:MULTISPECIES: glycosyltransferase family 4 protein [Haloarcula]AEM59479.1 LPS biosynthesis protein [Haloarcula hispanica ATCC 33960]AHB68323.1 glycosyl transferase family 1 [Haloarcula hispanica N601]AJF27682.1 glycosyl transferase family 1 [Haloarcula sp. CBA1115]KAA9404954.1 glycosyltransferase family 1 protein [Haloarcula hispanica]KZX46527.1 glycosyl transferase family 1 [Haloarcula sp. K1]